MSQYTRLIQRVLTRCMSICGAAVPSALAQPANFTDLGAHIDAEMFDVPVHLVHAADVQWFRIELPNAIGEDGFVDIWTMFTSPDLPITDIHLPDVAVFDDQGVLRTTALHDGPEGGAQMSFGLTDPRPTNCIAATNGETYCGIRAFDGVSGSIDEGVWWIAVGQSWVIFGPSGWTAQGTSTRAGRNTILNFRIQPAGEPYCDGDFNWDGNIDQEDAWYLINVIAGGQNETGRWADYNRDGNEDQDDVLALIHTIAGGGCP
jgi:hypothetical protein